MERSPYVIMKPAGQGDRVVMVVLVVLVVLGQTTFEMFWLRSATQSQSSYKKKPPKNRKRRREL